MARISTSSSGGNVNIQDTNGNEITSSSGALNVNVVSQGAAGTGISLYNEITGIAIGASSVILTYTVPPGQQFSLDQVLVSSDSLSTIEIEIDGSTNTKGRISYMEYNLSFDYKTLEIASGIVINLIATNNSLQGVASFNATLQGVLN